MPAGKFLTIFLIYQRLNKTAEVVLIKKKKKIDVKMNKYYLIHYL
jgi:hypothetical protein